MHVLNKSYPTIAGILTTNHYKKLCQYVYCNEKVKRQGKGIQEKELYKIEKFIKNVKHV